VKIEQWSAEQAQAGIGELNALLIDSVDNGASIGFLPPLSAEESAAYWASVAADVRAGEKFLLVARNDAGMLVGSAQLALASKANARHRAEVQKVMVHTAARRQGLAFALMRALDALAQQHGRTLLVLDTRQGDPSEQLYQKCGYTMAGVIPAYARNGDGGLDATVLYYRQLPAML
jgi:ribosomal protein S18 acetylase RimI-like enzyme